MGKHLQTCLTIAGSDPSGGAGIQADLKTFTVLNVYGCAVITCLTAQNSTGVKSYQEVDGELIRQQIKLVLEDLPITNIKIGMVGSLEAAEAIGRSLKDFSGQVVYDPVLKSSAGNDLHRNNTLPAILEHVIPKATVLTPNLSELSTLTNIECNNLAELEEAALILFNKFPNLEACIATGGHLPTVNGLITDSLFLNKENNTPPYKEQAHHKKLETSNTHGTGCTFSSAYTAFHSKLKDHRPAFLKTVAFMEELLEKSSDYNTGKGRGGMVHHLFKNQQ